MPAFPYTFTMVIPTFSGLLPANYVDFPNGDFGGFSIDLFIENDPNPLAPLSSANPQLSSTAIGGGINLGFFKFSGPGSYITSGNISDTSGNFTVSFTVTISSGSVLIVINEVSSSNLSYPLPLRVSSSGSTISLLLIADDSGGWGSHSFSSSAIISGGNFTTLTKQADAWNGPVNNVSTYTTSWTLTDVASGNVPVTVDPTNAQRYGIILRGDTGIWRVTAVNGNIMSLTPYELPQHNIRETAAL